MDLGDRIGRDIQCIILAFVPFPAFTRPFLLRSRCIEPLARPKKPEDGSTEKFDLLGCAISCAIIAAFVAVYAMGFRPKRSIFAGVGNACVIIYSNIEDGKYTVVDYKKYPFRDQFNWESVRWALLGMIDVCAAIVGAGFSPLGPCFCFTNILALFVCLWILAPLAVAESSRHIAEINKIRYTSRQKEREFWSQMFRALKEATHDDALMLST